MSELEQTQQQLAEPELEHEPQWLWVRSTINMRELSRGEEVWIDVTDPVFGPLLEARYLIACDPWGPPP
jgi:hypothetical protein